jgi:hypothetical protein
MGALGVLKLVITRELSLFKLSMILYNLLDAINDVLMTDP